MNIDDGHFVNDNSKKGVRITLPDPEDMTPAQKQVFEDVINGPRGVVVGPLRAVIHSPELADRWQRLGEFVRYKTVFPEILSELAILISARRWNSDVEWGIHRRIAEGAGLEVDVIEAIRDGHAPSSEDERIGEIYAFVQELQMSAKVSDPIYIAIKDRWGEQGIVELTGLVGYYTMVAMMLNAHHVPFPPEVSSELRGDDGETPNELSLLAPALGKRDA